MNKFIECRVAEDSLHFMIHTERLDASAANDLKHELEAVWLQHFTSIHVDMARVEFIDSSGVGALLTLAKKLAPEGKKIRLLKVKNTVRGVLDLLRLVKIFEIRNS